MHQIDAPIEVFSNQEITREGRRDQVVIGFDSSLRKRLAGRQNEFDLVGPALLDRMIGCLGADRDPVQPCRQLEHPIGFDSQLIAARFEHADQIIIEL